MSNWKKEVESVEKILDSERLDKSESKQIKKVMATNHLGKTYHKRGKNNSENNHRKPRNFIARNSTFTNAGASLGMTDEQYREYLKTGTFPNKKDK